MTTQEDASVVQIRLIGLKRGKLETLSLPDLRGSSKVLRVINVDVRHSEEAREKLKHCLHSVELKLVSNGNILTTISPALLRRLDNKVAIQDHFSIDNANNLTLQVKPLVDCDYLEMNLEYHHHNGYPLYHNEWTLLNSDDRLKFFETLVREAKKMNLVKIDLTVNDEMVKTIKISDPFTIDGESYQIEINSCQNGQFTLNGPINLSDLIRAKLEFIDDSGSKVNPNLLGLVIWGYNS